MSIFHNVFRQLCSQEEWRVQVTRQTRVESQTQKISMQEDKTTRTVNWQFNVGANSNVEHDRIFSRGDTASASALKNDEPFTKCFDIINILTKTYFIYSIHTSKQTTQFSFCLDHFPTDKLWKTAHVHVSRSSPSPWVHWNSPGLSLWGWCIPLHRWVKLSE